MKITLATVCTGVYIAFLYLRNKDTRDVLLAVLALAISHLYLTVAPTEAAKILIKIRYRTILVSTGRVLSPDVLPSPKSSVCSWVSQSSTTI